MTLDLAKLFGVKEGELFTISSSYLPKEYLSTKFFIKDNKFWILEDGKEIISILRLNDIDWNDFSIIKVKEKIKFSSDELHILKQIYNNTAFRYMTKDDSEIWFFIEKPMLLNELGKKPFWDVEVSNSEAIYTDGNLLLNVFKSLPNFTCVDLNDYVENFKSLDVYGIWFPLNQRSDLNE